MEWLLGKYGYTAHIQQAKKIYAECIEKINSSRIVYQPQSIQKGWHFCLASQINPKRGFEIMSNPSYNLDQIQITPVEFSCPVEFMLKTNTWDSWNRYQKLGQAQFVHSVDELIPILDKI